MADRRHIFAGMNNLSTFEELDAWKCARELTGEVYGLGRRGPLARDFGLNDQLRRAAVSVMNNVAEGWESMHPAERIQFYNIARHSCGEVRSMTYVMLDNGYVSPAEQMSLRERCVRTGRLISGLLRSTRARH